MNLKKYITNINIESLNLTNEYNQIKTSNYQNLIEKNNEIIITKEINIKTNEQKERHYYWHFL